MIHFLSKSWETDNNLDGKYDSLHFEIKMPLADSEAIHSVQLMLIFDYQLHVSCTVQAILTIYVDLYLLSVVSSGELRQLRDNLYATMYIVYLPNFCKLSVQHKSQGIL